MVARLVAGLVALGVVDQAAAQEDSRSEAAVVTRSYAPTDEDFANPERGFYRQFTPFGTGTRRTPLSSQSLAKARQEGISLVRAYFVIDEFRDSPLSPDALQSIATDLDAVRQAGLKIIPRFAYNFPTIRTYREAVD